jgi:hypothetical protein
MGIRIRKGRRPTARLEALGVLGILARLVLLAKARSAEAHPPPTGPGVEILRPRHRRGLATTCGRVALLPRPTGRVCHIHETTPL